MKKYLFTIGTFLVIVLIGGCSKKTDNAANWVGTYSSTGTVYDSINQVTIAEINSTTIKILLQYHNGPILYTFDTVQSATA